MVANTAPQVILQPQPGSQSIFVACPVFECLIHGNRGGGKSLAMLMDFLQHVGVGFGQAWVGIIFRRNVEELRDIVRKSLEWIPKCFPEAHLRRAPQLEWHFPTGESLLFRSIERKEDFLKYQGHEYPWIGFEELTNWPDDYLYKQMMTCCRSSTEGMPNKVRASTNPTGPGHNWVKKRFNLGGPTRKIIGEHIHKAGEKPRVSVRSDLAENIALLRATPGYREQIKMGATSTAQERAWLLGDWNVIAGGMFDDLWENDLHVVPSFPLDAIPKRWSVDRSYDHGSTKPFSVGWWAESNGEPFKWEGRVMGTVPGDLFRIAEWYGSPSHDNEGLRLTAVEIAEGILDREQDMGLFGRVHPGPADDAIFSAQEAGRPSVHNEFRRIGVSFIKCHKGPGSRVAGWEVVRERLRGAKVPISGYREDPGIFFCSRCIDAIGQIPSLPRKVGNEDDVDTESMDHIGDEVRYRVTKRKVGEISGSWR